MELQQGDNIKLKKEGPRGIWFAEVAPSYPLCFASFLSSVLFEHRSHLVVEWYDGEAGGDLRWIP